MGEYDVNIEIKFTGYYDSKYDASSIRIYVDGHEKDPQTMDDELKKLCIIHLRSWADSMFEDMFK